MASLAALLLLVLAIGLAAAAPAAGSPSVRDQWAAFKVTTPSGAAIYLSVYMLCRCVSV